MPKQSSWSTSFKALLLKTIFKSVISPSKVDLQSSASPTSSRGPESIIIGESRDGDVGYWAREAGFSSEPEDGE